MTCMTPGVTPRSSQNGVDSKGKRLLSINAINASRMFKHMDT
jgi:hypothetical protein